MFCCGADGAGERASHSPEDDTSTVDLSASQRMWILEVSPSILHNCVTGGGRVVSDFARPDLRSDEQKAARAAALMALRRTWPEGDKEIVHRLIKTTLALCGDGPSESKDGSATHGSATQARSPFDDFLDEAEAAAAATVAARHADGGAATIRLPATADCVVARPEESEWVEEGDELPDAFARANDAVDGVARVPEDGWCGCGGGETQREVAFVGEAEDDVPDFSKWVVLAAPTVLYNSIVSGKRARGAQPDIVGGVAAGDRASKGVVVSEEELQRQSEERRSWMAEDDAGRQALLGTAPAVYHLALCGGGGGTGRDATTASLMRKEKLDTQVKAHLAQRGSGMAEKEALVSNGSSHALLLALI